MGVVCCNRVTNETKCHELNIDSEPGSTSCLKLDGEKPVKIGRSKTLAGRQKRKDKLPKVATDAIQITPSQFVMENQGILAESYKFLKQMGQGIRVVNS